MNTLFLGIVIFLIVLAVFDLMVGVSNDAVNFLNSAIGAKVARYRTVVTDGMATVLRERGITDEEYATIIPTLDHLIDALSK